MSDLIGKIALVTGGSRSLGKSIALKLADRGADVVITYRTKENDANEVVRAIEAKGRRAAALQVDLDGTADLPRFLERLKDELNERTGRSELDILVNNAGITRAGVIGQVSEADYDAIMNTNLKSVFFLTQALLPSLRDGGRIILIGSGLSRFSLPPYIVYAASKAALATFAQYMAKTLGPRGITANVVAPGALDTDFNRAAFEANPGVVEAIASNTAGGRVGLPQDVDGVVAFLASDEAGWITGQRIEVSGGMFL
jgi:NAD(P)-dependent dehydrogenase (short-subunit alcohol dehydrogenase family)